MSFDLGFSEEFFTGTEEFYDPCERPTNCLQAIESLSDKELKEIAFDVFGMDEDHARYWIETEMCPYQILDAVRETNTCTDLTSPIEVRIDAEGYHTFLVYDEER